MPEEVTHIRTPFPSVAFLPFDGKTVEVTYYIHPADAESITTATGTLIAANGAGVIVLLGTGKHAWIALQCIVGMVEQ